MFGIYNETYVLRLWFFWDAASYICTDITPYPVAQIFRLFLYPGVFMFNTLIKKNAMYFLTW